MHNLKSLGIAPLLSIVTVLSTCKSTDTNQSGTLDDVTSASQATAAAGGATADQVDIRGFPGVDPHADIDEQSYLSLPTVQAQGIDEAVLADRGQAAGAAPDTALGLADGAAQRGPLIGGADDCDNLAKALRIVNRAVNAGGKCQAWFDKRGPVAGPFYVIVESTKLACLSEAPTWTFPGFHNIGMCRWACKKEAVEIASLLTHEFAHHYCPSFFGREDCAVAAQAACAEETN